MKRRYCIVGTGGRGILMFGHNIAAYYKETAEIVALCDVNAGRVHVAKEVLGLDVPVFTNFDRMMTEVECDAVIIASRDDTHHEYVIRTLAYGKDAITEKPMTVDEEKCKAILQAERESRGKVHVTFNYRFVSYAGKIKQLLDSGEIGNVFSVDFQWYLDSVHGASYFRRWNRIRAYSGGLLVHKSTHHFDLVNWWLGQRPEQVFAYGSRNRFGDAGSYRGERCSNCQHTSICSYYLDINRDEWITKLYIEHEKDDGYIRDRCVFDPAIDIEDTMSVLVRYSGGAQLNYSLTATAPFEGWRVGINGSKGRLEAFLPESCIIAETPQFERRKSSEFKVSADWNKMREGEMPLEVMEDEIRIYPSFGGVKSYIIPRKGQGENEGGHWGSDMKMLDMLMRNSERSNAQEKADSLDGALSILIGVAANHSIKHNIPVNIDDLLTE